MRLWKRDPKCSKHIGIPQSNHMAIKFFLIFWKCFEIWPFSNYLYLKIPLEHLQQCSICDVAKNIFHIQVELSYVLFCNPTHKTKTRDIKKAGRLLIANHLDQSLWWANRNHWAAVRSYLLHSFWEVNSVAVPFTRHGNMRNYVKPNPFPCIKPSYLGFSSPNFTMQITYWALFEMLLAAFFK
jgi:hypothetical protein